MTTKTETTAIRYSTARRASYGNEAVAGVVYGTMEAGATQQAFEDALEDENFREKASHSGQIDLAICALRNLAVQVRDPHMN